MMEEKKSILIAEIDLEIANEVKNFFELQGYTIHSILTTGEDLLLQAKILRPSLIITDTRLNGYLDGIEAISRLGNETSIPYIFITSFDDDIRLIRSYYLKPLCLIQKPINPMNLKISIERVSANLELV